MNQPTRERVIGAMLTIIADRGLDEVSVRNVAAEAKVSIGTVQYYARSKDEMLLLAFRTSLEALVARLERQEDTGSARDIARRALWELLPLDADRLAEQRVHLAFAARSAVTTELAEVHAGYLRQVWEGWAAGIRRAQDKGSSPAGLDAETEAQVLIATAEGLVVHHLTDPTGMPLERVCGLLETVLERLFPDPPAAAATSLPA